MSNFTFELEQAQIDFRINLTFNLTAVDLKICNN